MTQRKKVPEKIQDELLISSKRRCALCFGLRGDLEEKRGQIAHIDRNSSNAKIENLAFLCFEHHDEYDSKTSQSKNITSGELKHYKNKLYEYLQTKLFKKIEQKNQQLLAEDKSIIEIDFKQVVCSYSLFEKRVDAYKKLFDAVKMDYFVSLVER